jgi:hypothetical protein
MVGNNGEKIHFTCCTTRVIVLTEEATELLVLDRRSSSLDQISFFTLRESRYREDGYVWGQKV